jgi:DNA-binding LacI/PurR family transcriptional regulator
MKKALPSQTGERVARLADVAREAGVSQGTVSNVFNKPGLVREEVRERVLEAARRLGYHGPDPKGRLLRAGKVNAIGVASVEPLSFFFRDPFARILMTGITEESQANGAGVSLVSAASEGELAWNVRNALVDGLILFCLEGARELIAAARERQLPFVALALGHEDETVPAVGVDNEGGARLAAQHLIDLGHRRFAVLGLRFSESRAGRIELSTARRTTYSASRDRLAGYFEVLAAAGIDTATVPVYETQNEEATILAALDAIFSSAEPPTALLSQSDRMALIAIDWLKARGMTVPDDVSIIGFDGVPEAATATPPLTTIAQPIADIGRNAVRIILEGGEGVQRRTLDVALVVRGSTAPPKR